ncbi:hypothetical protein, partial [Klebsiella pneumoniae]|uniref:hypothetical protein n=2 Tax=Enterobacterales TaxID=91347 RepID=UPI001E3CCD86
GTGRSRQAWLTNPTVSSNLEAGNTPPFQGCVGLTCLKRLYEGGAGSPVAPFSCLQEKKTARQAGKMLSPTYNTDSMNRKSH